MTVMYLGVRYLGIFYAALSILDSVATISLTDTECFIVSVVWNWITAVVCAMLWVIIVTRLYAMYLRSRKILIFLIVIFLAVNIFDVVTATIITMYTSGEELILSGIYQCSISQAGNILLLDHLTWILGIVFEVCEMCLAIWIAVKHFRELRHHSAGEIIRDCFTVLMKTHMLYFAGFVVLSCFQVIYELSPIADSYSLYVHIYGGVLSILKVVQMFVIGPRLILSIREYHAKLVVNSDAATAMTSIAFQERVYISTGSSV
ncbi:hypothetical protein BDR07DRAFT_1409616 [Suillus spraguei]|nr:hypothetical protein BDR07DRAFT_1409616 [Suillus spraguei]